MGSRKQARPLDGSPSWWGAPASGQNFFGATEPSLSLDQLTHAMDPVSYYSWRAQDCPDPPSLPVTGV